MNQWQTNSQILRAISRGGTELSQADGVAIEGSDDFPAEAGFERDVDTEPGRSGWGYTPSPSFYFGARNRG